MERPILMKALHASRTTSTIALYRLNDAIPAWMTARNRQVMYRAKRHEDREEDIKTPNGLLPHPLFDPSSQKMTLSGQHKT